MCQSYLSLLSPFLFSCKHVFFSVRGGGLGWGGGRGGGAGLQSYKWDLLFFYLLLLFLKNALLSLLFHSKMSFTRKNPEFFPRSLGFINQLMIFFSEHTAKHLFFSFNPKGLSV